MLQLRVARSAQEVEALASPWHSLLHQGLSLFQSHRWNLLAAKIFGQREEPYFIFAEDDNGAAILPAVIQTRSKTIGFAGECLFDYRDYLAGGDSAALRAAWQKVAALDLPLSITAICRTEDRIWGALPRLFFSRAPRLHRDESTAEQFVQRHARAFSRLRKLERMGLRITEYSGDSPIAADIYRLRAAQSKPGELFSDALRAEFMVAACRSEGSGCRIFALEHGSTLAAALVTFRDSTWRRFYTIFYDHRWARFSPGTSLLFEAARRSLKEGIDIDLMTGEQPYKMRLTKNAADLFKVSASRAEMHSIFPPPAAIDAAA